MLKLKGNEKSDSMDIIVSFAVYQYKLKCCCIKYQLISYCQDFFAKSHSRSPDSIYHVTVMPCFDKKLEASRSDFYSDLYSTRDVDCVITAG